MTQFDTVVIGAGNAGLTAAVAAQRAGSKTLLLERHNIPGGCATSFVRGDFEFEVALHQLSGMGTKEEPFIMQYLFMELGIMDKIEMINEQELYRIVMPGEIDITLPASWPKLREVLIEHYPAEADSIPQFLDLCEALTHEQFMAMPKVQKKNSLEMLNQKCANYVKYGLKSAKDVLDEFFQDEDLKNSHCCLLVLSGYATKRYSFQRYGRHALCLRSIQTQPC